MLLSFWFWCAKNNAKLDKYKLFYKYGGLFVGRYCYFFYLLFYLLLFIIIL